MSRYQRLTIEGQRVDIDADGNVGVIDGGAWVLSIGKVRRHPAARSRWQAVPERTGWGRPPEPPASFARHLTRRSAILGLLNLTAWAPARAASRTPLPADRDRCARGYCRNQPACPNGVCRPPRVMRDSGEDREVTRLLRQYDGTVEALWSLGIDVVRLRAADREAQA